MQTTGCVIIIDAFQHNGNLQRFIRDSIQLMTGNIKPRYLASRSLDVDIVGDDDGLDGRAQARPSPDDVGHIQCLSCRHDACLEQLQARMGDGRDFLLLNAPLALVEWVEVR